MFREWCAAIALAGLLYSVVTLDPVGVVCAVILLIACCWPWARYG